MNVVFERPGVSSSRLAAATILHIVPAMRETADARGVIDIVRALRQTGARCIVASETGPLVPELKSCGGEWIDFPNFSRNPLRLRSNARRLEKILAMERIDIVHAHGAGAAWSASAATERLALWLVTSLPAIPPPRGPLRTFYESALGRGDRVIAHSSFAAATMIERFGIPRDRVAVVPYSIALGTFDPATLRHERPIALRKAWGIRDGERVILVPESDGQSVLVDAAWLLIRDGLRGVTFVLQGDTRAGRKQARAAMKHARMRGIERCFRVVTSCRDLPAAFAASDIVVLPSIQPPTFGHPLPEAQAMARPVVASAVGILPENVLAPPRMPDELRTGWLVAPNDHVALADALNRALGLDIASYRALAARARQFAEFAFAPKSAAAAILGVYLSLLEGG